MLQLVSATCLLIAMKQEEIARPSLDEIIAFSNNSFRVSRRRWAASD